jgi:hypothetical protein
VTSRRLRQLRRLKSEAKTTPYAACSHDRPRPIRRRRCYRKYRSSGYLLRLPCKYGQQSKRQQTEKLSHAEGQTKATRSHWCRAMDSGEPLQRVYRVCPPKTEQFSVRPTCASQPRMLCASRYFAGRTMQHTQEAYLCSQMLRIACDLERLCTEPKEQVVNHPLILQSKWRQFVRQSEDDMDKPTRLD